MTVAVAAVRTGGPTPRAWLVARGQALYDAFRRRGLPSDVALAAAVAVLPHAANETGWGRAEWNYNLGNIKCAGAPTCATQPDGQAYRAYATAGAGAEAYVRLLEAPRYRAALAYLLATRDAPGFFARLVAAGWTGEADVAAAVANYVAILRRIDPRRAAG